ncbi:MerR family transcriptional regulator [Mariniluteicoccus flavus]
MAITTAQSERTTTSLTVSEVAREAGVAASAVRFYDRHGVVTAVRTTTNQRRFDQDAACRIKVAKGAQRVGLTVAEIRDLLAGLPNNPRAEEWAVVCDDLIASAEQRIADLRSALHDLGTDTRLCELPRQSTA